MEIGPRHVRGLPAPPRRPVLRDKIALAGPEKPDCASATSLLLYSRDGAGPPERVKAGQGLTGSARAPGAVPDGVRDSFTPWSPLQSSPRACGSVGIARRPHAWVPELPCGDEMTWLGPGGRIAHRQAKARRLRPAGLCSERNLTPFVSGFSGGRVKQHPIANPNRHGGEAFGVRTTWGWVQ